MDFAELLDQEVEAPYWPEPVRILRLAPAGAFWEVVAEGRSGRVYRDYLRGEDLEALRQGLKARPPALGADPGLFALGVEAYRIRLGHLFDPFFAVSVSRVDPLPHQLEAVYGVLLKRPRVRFLLADDPGAGKTIMAGLLLKELKHRGVVERVLIVVPANLLDQWRRELKEKFGEDLEVLNRETREALFAENPWARRAQVLTSLDFAKRPENLQQLRQVHWDLAIVDEAHKLSATRYGGEVKKSQRYQLGEVLSETAHHLLFLTATPHQGDEERFRLLLDLLEPGLFAYARLLKEAARAGENPLVLRRLKEEMVDFGGRPLFPPRHVHTQTFRLAPSEKALYEKVSAYVRERYQRAFEEDRRPVGLAMTILQRRLASSTQAVAQSLENRLRRLESLREKALEAFQAPDPEELEDLSEAQRWRWEEELLARLTPARNLAELEAELQELRALVREAKALARLEDDRKFRELLKVLEALGGEKLLVFTEHKATLDFLVRALVRRGYRVARIEGSMPLEERIREERRFRDEAQVMVATEAAGEGINLQFASFMVNYDLPWNPTRLEQRMGRVHRYGQRHEVHVYNLVAEDTREGAVLKVLLDKLERIRRELGSDRVYDVVGEILAGADLERLIMEHLTGRRSLAEVQALLEARLSPERLRRLQEDVAVALARELDLSQLKAEREVSEARRLTPEYTQAFFTRAFPLLGGRMEGRRVRVPLALAQKDPRIEREYRRVVFHPKEEGELLAPGHPLFDRVLEEVLERARPHLAQGASLYADVEEEGLLVVLVLGVRDGLGQAVARGLRAVFRGAGGIQPLPLEVLLGAEPAPPPEPLPPLEDWTREALAWAQAELLPPFLAEAEGRRKEEVAIRRKYGLRSLDHLILESNRKLLELKAEGRPQEMRLAIRQEEERLERLIARREALEAELNRAERLLPEAPQVLARAYLRPRPQAEGEDPALKALVERRAMEVAMAYERAQGREPKDVSRENLGYDLVSGDRFIEVKGRAGAGGVVLTPNEWVVAGRLRERYWLYIVVDALGSPRLFLVQDPAGRLRPEEVMGVVRYELPLEAWRSAAEEAGLDG